MSQTPAAGMLNPLPPRSPLRLRTNTLLGLALILWVVSLGFTGLVLYAEQRHIVGAEILMTGWLSPLLLNFGWFANPLFIWVALRLQAGKSASGLALLTVLLSLDALRFSHFLLDEGGGSTQVYGYGWGVVLWFMAIGAMAATAGTRQIELRLGTQVPPTIDEWLRPLGLVLCLAVPAVAAYWAMQDREVANAKELTRLSGIAFKRGPVCEAREPFVAQPLVSGLGSVELKLTQRSAYASLYPFSSVRTLLEWGIPIVRFAARDYSLAVGADGPLLTSVAASTTPLATLWVAAGKPHGVHQISVKLVDQATERVVFDQVWDSEIDGIRYCPDFGDEQPRKIVTEALTLPALSGERPASVTAPNRADGVLVGEVDGTAIPTKSGRTSGALTWQGNGNCPESVGWAGSPPFRPEGLDTGWAFVGSDKAFYPGNREQYQALCVEGHAYLYSGRPDRGKYHLTLEKRRLSDFHRVGSGTIVIQDPQLAAAAGMRVNVASVDEGADEMTIWLRKDQAPRLLVVKTQLKLSR